MNLLLIEDNPDLAGNLCDFLESRRHSVDVMQNGLSGLRFALDKSYDAIILDLTLPGMDGLEICQRLRSSGHETPVLMLTARDALQDKLDGFDAGADDYLVKPFAMQELDARLSALVRRGNTHQRARLAVQDLRFDPATLRVERAGRRVELAPIPLRILSLLIRRSPAVVPRHEIEQAIWGDDLPDSDALRAHIHALRTAVDGNNDEPLLRTVRGIGYQLAGPNDR